MKKRWNDHMMFSFCTNMSMVLESGLTLHEGLEIVHDTLDQNQEDIELLLHNVEQKGSLSASIQDVPFFDNYAKKMIEIGELNGTLDAVLQELAMYYERNYDIKQSLKEALLYPFLLLVMMWCIILVIIWKILPIFSSVLSRMGTILPGNAMSMMRFGDIFGYISFLLLSLLLIICVAVFVVNKRANGNALAFMPFTKKFYYALTMSKLTYAFSLFMSSGYDVADALLYLKDVIDHPKTRKKLLNCHQRMEQGETIVHAMTAEKIYHGIYANMIYTGFRSGQSDDVLKKASLLFEKDVDHSISSFLNIIEPSVVILLSIIVGIILLSVMLPLMSIITSL